ncbi:hypothetical protein [Methylomicrobium lacus]|uniref:hypothetical protein n=1 Tax=Methylomicrobium lacus TaxID=136992 RepID=UPI0035A896CA
MKEEAQALTAFLAAIVTATAALNLFLYWGQFDINPFVFVRVSDIFPVAAPFITQAAVVLSAVYFSILIFPPETSDGADQHGIKRYVIPIWIVAFAVCLLVFYFSEALGHRGTLLAFSALIGMSAVFFKEIVRLKEWDLAFKSHFSRRTAAFAAVYMPIMSVFLAYCQSEDILNNRSFSYVISTDLKIDLGGQQRVELPLLGKLGDLYVVVTPDLKQKIFLSSDNFNVIRIGNKQMR